MRQICPTLWIQETNGTIENGTVNQSSFAFIVEEDPGDERGRKR